MQAKTYNRSFTEALYFIINFHWEYDRKEYSKKGDLFGNKTKG